MINKFVIGNWKMHGNFATVANLMHGIINNLPDNLSCNCVVLPPFIFIPQVYELIKNSKLELGAQNLYPKDNGAFTGEISGTMLNEFACKYVLVGHSERRQILQETDKLIAAKFHYAKESQLTPILCVGETLEEREKGLTLEVITTQLLSITENATTTNVFDNCIIAYEPVWAIGTGQTATPEQAEEIHLFIRKFINNQTTPILYGGSVNENNAKELFSKPNINGGLIGGASLDYLKFLKIVSFT